MSYAPTLQQEDLSIPTHPDLPEIAVSISESVLLGGKRLRPMFTYLSGQFFGVSEPEIKPFARGAELTHAATLCHDDVVDAAVVRRNRPTLNRLVGNARAVLAGDILLSRVVREVVDQGNIEVLTHLCQVLEDLSAGEWLQLNFRHRIDATRKTLERISELKTGALLGWCVATPARVAGRSSEEIEKATRLGQLLGLSFQMIDDTIDFDPSTEKAFAKDLREGMVNFVTLEVLEQHPEFAEGVQAIWKQTSGSLLHPSLKAPREALPWGMDLTEIAVARVRSRVQTQIQQAREILESLSGEQEARARLNELLDALVERRH